VFPFPLHRSPAGVKSRGDETGDGLGTFVERAPTTSPATADRSLGSLMINGAWNLGPLPPL